MAQSQEGQSHSQEGNLPDEVQNMIYGQDGSASNEAIR